MNSNVLDKNQVITEYFDRTTVQGKPYLKRKLDAVEIPLFHFAFYNTQQILEIGQGFTTPTFLVEDHY